MPLAVTCCKRPPEPGKTRCSECLKKTAESSRQAKVAAAKAGLCVVCFKRPAISGKRKCKECLLLQREREESRQQERERFGLCIRCGKDFAIEGKKCCAKCNKNQRDRDRRKLQALKPSARISIRLKTTARKYGVSASGLSLLYREQGGRCSYCGSRMSLHRKQGQTGYCHLDHKTPIARGGADELENFQWLCGRCNHHKGALTDDEYRRAKNISCIS